MINTQTSDARECGRFARGCLRHSENMFDCAKREAVAGDYSTAKVYLLAMHHARSASETLTRLWKHRQGFGSALMGLLILVMTVVPVT